MAYVPFANHPDAPDFQRGLKRYRGGTASPIWIAELADSRIEKVPRTDSDDARPMWVGDTVYFLSDRDGPASLYAYDTKTKQVKAVLAKTTGEIKAASAGPDAIVYEQLDGIYLLDLASRQSRRVDIRVAGDFPAVRPHWVDASRQIEAAGVSPTGARAVFEARGDILTVPAERGDIRNLTRSSGVADRDPAWSPDGKSIAYFSDASGEYALHVAPQDGRARSRSSTSARPPSFFYAPRWSPDSKKIAFSDKRLNLWLLDLAAGKPVKVDTNPFDGFASEMAWAPDSRWLAYTRQLKSQLRAVFVYSLDREEPPGHGRHERRLPPPFDEKGKYLFFIASTDIGPVLASSMASYNVPLARAAYVVVLRNDLRSPLAHRSDEEKVEGGRRRGRGAAERVRRGSEDAEGRGDAKDGERRTRRRTTRRKTKPKPVRIDLADIDQRVLALPVPVRNYAGCRRAPGTRCSCSKGRGRDRPLPRAHCADFDFCTRKFEQSSSTWAVSSCRPTARRRCTSSSRQPDPLAPDARARPRPVVPAGGGCPGEAQGADEGPPQAARPLVHAGPVDPRAEWRQIYDEAWRIQRDFFYDPNLHGVDCAALSRLRPLPRRPREPRRPDLSPGGHAGRDHGPAHLHRGRRAAAADARPGRPARRRLHGRERPLPPGPDLPRRELEPRPARAFDRARGQREARATTS